MLSRILIQFLIFGIVLNYTWIIWFLTDDMFIEGLDIYFVFNRIGITIIAFAYAGINFKLIEKYLVQTKKRPFYFLMILLFSLVSFFIYLRFRYNIRFGMIYKRMISGEFLEVGPAFYFLITFNCIGLLVFLPRLIASYRKKNEKMKYEIFKNDSLSSHTTLFTNLYIESLNKISIIPNKAEREKFLIQLSDFYRFVVYESNAAYIPITKAIYFSNLYLEIIETTYPKIQIKNNLPSPNKHFNTSSMNILHTLQKLFNVCIHEDGTTFFDFEGLEKDRPNAYYYSMTIENDKRNLISFIAQNTELADSIFSLEPEKNRITFESKKIIASTLV